MSLRWVPISSLPVPYRCFEIRKNIYPNSIKSRKPHQFRFGSDGYLCVRFCCHA